MIVPLLTFTAIVLGCTMLAELRIILVRRLRERGIAPSVGLIAQRGADGEPRSRSLSTGRWGGSVGDNGQAPPEVRDASSSTEARSVRSHLSRPMVYDESLVPIETEAVWGGNDEDEDLVSPWVKT